MSPENSEAVSTEADVVDPVQSQLIEDVFDGLETPADTVEESTDANEPESDAEETPAEEPSAESEVEVDGEEVEPESTLNEDPVEDDAQEEQEPTPDEPTEAKQEPEADEPKEPEVEESSEEEDAGLRAQVTELSRMLAASQSGTQDGGDSEQEAALVPLEAVDFVADEEHINAVLADPAAFNKLLNDVRQSAFEEARRIMTTELPAVMRPLVATQVTMERMTTEFYTSNEDLHDIADYVQIVANDLSAKNPDWRYDQLYKVLGPEVRKRLKMPEKPAGKASKASTVKKRGRPAFAGRTPARSSNDTPKLTETEKLVQGVIMGD